MGKHLFISYSHDDLYDVKEYVEKLNEIFEVWVDNRDIEAGKSFDDEIANALADCVAVLVFRSPSYDDSDYCLKEISYAVNTLHKEYIVINLDDRYKDTSRTKHGMAMDLLFSSGSQLYPSDDIIPKLQKNPTLQPCKHNGKPTIPLFFPKKRGYREFPEPRKENPNPFEYIYDTDRLKLIGREKELALLEEFADAPGNHWAMVTGEAGSGKSRMCLEFAFQMNAKGWDTWYIADNIKERIKRLKERRHNNDLLVVIDYTFAFSDEVSDYLHFANSFHDSRYRIKVILVERNYGTESKPSRHINDQLQLTPAMTEKELPFLKQKDGIREMMYKYEEDLLPYIKLERMSKEEIKRIVKQFAPKVDTGTVFSALRMIDPGLERPLFALFIADALQEGKDVAEWNREQALEYILNREFIIWKKIGSFDPTIINDTEDALLSLMAHITFHGGVLFDKLMEECKEEIDIIKHNLHDKANNNVKRFLRNTGNLTENDYVVPLRPDLFGEYTVLKYMRSGISHTNALFFDGWHKHTGIRQFLANIYLDYKKDLLEIPQFHDCLYGVDTSSMEEDEASGYAELLSVYSEQEDNRLLEQTKHLFHQYATLSTAVAYCEILKERIKQEDDKKEEYLSTIGEIYLQYDNRSLALPYANALLFMITAPEDPTYYSDQLDKVYERFPLNQPIQELFKKALSLAIAGAIEEEKEIVDEMEQAYNEHPSDLAASALSHALSNLTFGNTLEGTRECVARIDDLYAAHGTDEVADYLLKALHNLGVRSLREDVWYIAMDLRELFNFSKNAVVAEECEYVLQDYFENYNRPAGTIRGHSGRYPEKLPPYVDILKDAVETYEELLAVFPNDKWQQRHDTLHSLLVVERNRIMEETMHQASVDAVVQFIQSHRSKRIVPVEKDDVRVVSALNSYAKYAEGDDVIGMVDMK